MTDLSPECNYHSPVNGEVLRKPEGYSEVTHNHHDVPSGSRPVGGVGTNNYESHAA